MNWNEITQPTEETILLAGYDIRRTNQVATKSNSGNIFNMLHELSVLCQTVISSSQGKLIKMMGDSSICIFPLKQADAGIRAMMEFRRKGERLLAKYASLKISVFCHAGPVTIGRLGPDLQLDVIGKAVNTLFKLENEYPRKSVVITPEAFRKLKKETRVAFHKYTPPIVYTSD